MPGAGYELLRPSHAGVHAARPRKRVHLRAGSLPMQAEPARVSFSRHAPGTPVRPPGHPLQERAVSPLPDLSPELLDAANDAILRTPRDARAEMAELLAGRIRGHGRRPLTKDSLILLACRCWQELDIVPSPQPGRRRGGGRRRA